MLKVQSWQVRLSTLICKRNATVLLHIYRRKSNQAQGRKHKNLKSRTIWKRPNLKKKRKLINWKLVIFSDRVICIHFIKTLKKQMKRKKSNRILWGMLSRTSIKMKRLHVRGDSSSHHFWEETSQLILVFKIKLRYLMNHVQVKSTTTYQQLIASLIL